MNVTRVAKLTDEKFINLFAAFYEHNGKTNKWVFASRNQEPNLHAPPPINAVVIVPFVRGKKYGDGKDKLLVIKEFRVPINNHEYAFPAGLLDKSEDPLAASFRELEEETGLKVVKKLLISPPMISSAGLSDECVAYVLVEANGRLSTKKQEATEDITPMLLTRKQVGDLCHRRGKFKDAIISAKMWPFLLAYSVLGIEFATSLFQGEILINANKK
jgi:ADP-ribose pyrophosphatase